MPELPTRSVTLRKWLDLCAAAAVLLVSAVFLWFQFSPASQRPAAQRAKRELPPLPVEPLSVAGAPAVGQVGSSVVVIEYSEMQCPFCQRFELDVWPQFKKQFVDSGKVQVFFRHFPLESIHPKAFPAATALQCAALQDRFWQMKDLLLQAPGRLDREHFLEAAQDLRLSPSVFAECLNGPGASLVKASLAEAKAAGVVSTPTFLIGLRVGSDRVEVIDRVVGAQPLAAFTTAIDSAVSKIAARSK